jgi:hypothetical protein
MVDYIIKNGELLICTNKSGGDIYVGQVNGIKVEEVLKIPDTQDCIVLLNYLQAHVKQKSNILRIDETGKIKWEVGSPQKQDSKQLIRDEIGSYTGFFIRNGLLFAYDYSGFSDQIDMKTGLVLHSEFVK